MAPFIPARIHHVSKATGFIGPFLLAWLAFAGTVGIAAEVAPDCGNLYTQITPEVVTEHTPWARPYARPTPRILWIIAIENGGEYSRLAAELFQRLGADDSVSLVYSHQVLGSDTAKDSYWAQIATTREQPVRQDLADKTAGPWDVLIMEGVDWATLPDNVRQTISARVRQGAGLVFASPQTPPLPSDLAELFAGPVVSPTALQAAFPADQLSTFAHISPLVEAHTLGDGRIAVVHQNLEWPEDPAASGQVGRWADPVIVNFEYYMALLARTVLWAGHREPEVTMLTLNPTIDSKWPHRGSLEVSTSSSMPQARELTAEVTFRDFRNRRTNGPRQSVQIPTGAANRTLSLGNLNPGRQFVDVWLRDGERVVAWASAYLDVPQETPIREVQLQQASVERDQRIAGQVKLDPPVGPSEWSVRLFDNHGRLVGRQECPLTAGQTSMAFDLPAEPVTTPVAWLRCELTQAGKLLGCAEQEVMVAQRPPADDFVLAVSLIWSGKISNLAVEALRRRELSKYGVQYAYLWAGPQAAAGAARENQTGIPGSLNLGTLVVPKQVDEHPVRSPCLSDPQGLQDMERKVKEFATQFRPYGPPFLSLGGERFIGQTPHGAPDLCWSPSCLEVFRSFVRQQYGTLELLNRQYGTSYADWSQVLPGRWADCERSGNWSPWVDHMLAMDRVSTRFFSRAAQAVRETDPRVRVGWDSPVGLEWAAPSLRSSFVFQLNYDYPKLIESFTGMVPYDSQVDRELIRSLAPKGYYFSEWWGGYLADRYEWWLRFFPWRLVCKGANSSWYFHDQGPENALALDLRPTPWFRWANEELQEIRSGPAKLLLNAEAQQDGIAVLWSQNSYWAAAVAVGSEGPNRPHGRMLSLLQDLGLSYRYVTGEQLAAGKLKERGWRLLVLPWAQALNAEEAEAIRQFVQQGGTVLADVRPGTMDPHCKPLAAGQLDDVFGLKPRALEPAAKDDHGDFPLPRYERSWELSTGSLRENPASDLHFVVNRYGKGSTLLLNLKVDGYGCSEGGGNPPPGLRAEPASVPLRALIAELLADRGVVAPARLTLEGMPQAGVEIARYRLGEGAYIALLPDKEVDRREQSATVTLPSAGHLYDLRKGRYLGQVKTWNTTLARGVVQLYAILPYRAERLELSAPESVNAAEELVCRLRLQTSGGEPTTHVFHVELTDPTGASVPWFFRNVMGEHGECELRLPLAHNETPGRWLIRARDVATGLKAEQEVTVNPEKTEKAAK